MGDEIAMVTTDENRGAVSEKHWHSRERCDCLITAAGLSSRMGAWKLMLPYRQSTILDESLKNALVLCDRIILVVGHRADELISRYANHPVSGWYTTMIMHRGLAAPSTPGSPPVAAITSS